MNRREFLTRAAAGSVAMGAVGGATRTAGAAASLKAPMDREACAQYLDGPITSIITPFNKDGSIDFDGLRAYIDRSIEGGNKTVLLTAGDSQYICMSDKEIAEVTKVAAEHTGDRAMVVAADNDYATPQCLEFAEYAKGVGANVLMCKPPDWAQSCTAETFVEHFVAVSKVIPVMLVTNVFARRDHDLGLEVIRKAIEASDSIVAVKDDICGEFGQKLSVMLQGTGVVGFAGGLQVNHLNVVPYGGGKCYMSLFQATNPDITKRYWAAIEAKDIEKAEAIQKQYEAPYFDYLMTLQGGWNAGVHGSLELYCIAKRWRRKPYYSLSDAELADLESKMKELELL